MRAKVALFGLTVCLIVAAVAQAADGNLIVNPGLELKAPIGWTASSVNFERVKANPHSGVWCLYVKDVSSDHGQANSLLFTVKPGQCYVEAWLRVDPKLAKTAAEASPFVDLIPNNSAAASSMNLELDVQFSDGQKKYLSTQEVGKTNSTKWVRVNGVVKVPDNAAFASIRVLPTAHSPGVPRGQLGPIPGACFVDDLYVAPLDQAIAAGRARPTTEDPKQPDAGDGK